MDPYELATHWPYCYHVTYEANLASIRLWRALLSAEALFEAADQRSLSVRRRTDDMMIRVRKQAVVVRNQNALDPASLDLSSSGTVEEYVACLNSRAYFWPGTVGGPISDGARMCVRTGRSRIILRVRTSALLEVNRDVILCVSTCNTGAAWMHEGRKSRRGPDVFQSLERYRGPASDIVEISGARKVALPADTTYAAGLDGSWRALFDAT